MDASTSSKKLPESPPYTLILSLGLHLLTTFMGMGCMRSSQPESSVAGNVVSNTAKLMSPPYFRQVVIKCQKSSHPEAAYHPERPWELILYKQLDDTYVAYLKVNKSDENIKIYKKIINYEFQNSDQASRNFGMNFTYFSNAGFNQFALRLFDLYRWNPQGWAYNGELFDISVSLNPYSPQDMACTTASKVAIQPIKVEDKVYVVAPIYDVTLRKEQMKTLEISIDMTTSVAGHPVFYSLTKLSPEQDLPKGSPVFTKSGEFIGFIAEYQPKLPASIEIISVLNPTWGPQMYQENRSWGRKPQQTPTTDLKISSRYQQIICKFLVYGRPAPGTFPDIQGWENEWKKLVTEAQLASATCPVTSPKPSKPDSGGSGGSGIEIY